MKIDDVPVPEVGDSDVLVDVKAMGICGSDVNFRRGLFPPPAFPEFRPWKSPIISGHEYAGVVVKKGRNVKELSEGDRVSVHYSTSCGNCVWCNLGWDNLCLRRGDLDYDSVGYEGGFSEYALLPARNAFRLPDGIPMDQGAIIGCAVTTALHAVKVRGGLRGGDRVAVYGLGGVGLHAVQWASVLGASKIIGVDVDDFKLRMGKRFGADEVVDSEAYDPVKAIKDFTEGHGVSVAVDTVGTEKTLDSAINSVGVGGRVVAVGLEGVYARRQLPVAVARFLLTESMFTGSANHTRDDHRFSINYVASGKYDLSKSITHRMPFEKLNEAIDMLEEGKENIIRIVVTR